MGNNAYVNRSNGPVLGPVAFAVGLRTNHVTRPTSAKYGLVFLSFLVNSSQCVTNGSIIKMFENSDCYGELLCVKYLENYPS
jgi:hypothetical protein